MIINCEPVFSLRKLFSLKSIKIKVWWCKEKVMEVPKPEEKEEEIANLEELKKLMECFEGLEHLHSFFRDLTL